MKVSKKYYNDVKHLFPICGKKEKTFLKNLNKSIIALGDCSYENIVEELGEPTDIIAGYFQNVESHYLLKKLKVKNIIKYCCIIITITILLSCLWRTYILNQAYKDFENGIPTQFEESIEVIE